MESHALQQHLTDLTRRYILLDRDDQPENIRFSLWGRRAADGYALMAMTLTGDGRDLLEALDASLIRSAEADVNRIYLSGQAETQEASRNETYAHSRTAVWPVLAA